MVSIFQNPFCKLLSSWTTHSESLHAHSKFSRSVSDICGVNVGASLIKPKHEIVNLGSVFNKNLCCNSQINNTCRASFFALSNIRKIRRYLDEHQAERLIHAFVSTRIDHCNSLLIGAPRSQLDKLQRVLNAAAKLVRRPKSNETTVDVLQSLHWLPVVDRIAYKTLLLTFKARNGLGPEYLQSLLSEYNTSRRLRSSAQGLLTVPRSYTKSYGDGAFSIAAPRLWNLLPVDIRNSNNVDIFKSKLKTFLFKKAYNL